MKTKYDNLMDVTCPICGKKLKSKGTDNYWPRFICKNCSIKVVLEKKIFGDYKLIDIEKLYKCKKHGYSTDEKCEDCEHDKFIKKVKSLNFTKKQQELICKNYYWDWTIIFKNANARKTK